MTVTVGWKPVLAGAAGWSPASASTASASPISPGDRPAQHRQPDRRPDAAAGAPGSLVCQQSVLIGKGESDGREHSTSPACFKLRAADPPPPTRAGGRTPGRSARPRLGSRGPPAPPAPPARRRPRPPARRPAPGRPSRRGSPPGHVATPPARAAFEAAASAAAIPAARTATPAATPAKAAPAAGRATPTAGRPPLTLPPPRALARTGIDEHIPLAGAGALFAIGGLAIMFGRPRRRSWSGA